MLYYILRYTKMGFHVPVPVFNHGKRADLSPAALQPNSILAMSRQTIHPLQKFATLQPYARCGSAVLPVCGGKM
jgi:hypothetical protein